MIVGTNDGSTEGCKEGTVVVIDGCMVGKDCWIVVGDKVGNSVVGDFVGKEVEGDWVG